MERPAISESFALTVTKTSDGYTTLSIVAVLGEWLEEWNAERMYRSADVDHRVCDEASRLLVGWSQLGNLGLAQAMADIRMIDTY
jgi:hypothetical protein